MKKIIEFPVAVLFYIVDSFCEWLANGPLETANNWRKEKNENKKRVRIE